MAFWSDRTEEQLISLVEERPPMYSIAEWDYSNLHVKATLWRETEEQMHISEKEIKKNWDSLRTQYTQYHKLPPSGSAGVQRTVRQKWILSRLQFLEPRTKRRESSSNLI